MEDIRIKYSPEKLKKTAAYLWIMAGVFIVVFLIVRLLEMGFWGPLVYGMSLGAAIVSAYNALAFTLRIRDRSNKSASVAVISREGIRVTDEPYNYGLIRWELITGFIMKKALINIGSKYFIAPVLADQDAFMKNLPKKRRGVARQSKRFGSPAAFDVTNAELAPGDILELCSSRLEEMRDKQA